MEMDVSGLEGDGAGVLVEAGTVGGQICVEWALYVYLNTLSCQPFST
jgi:hypothetical protein